MIPKKIFYVWFGGNPLSPQIKKNLMTWKKNNPDYDLIKIDETNFDINQVLFMKDAYDSGNWAFASDVARLLVVYQNGGFYFDTDVKILKSLDKFLSYKSVWGMEIPGIINSGLVIGAQKGDNDLKSLINIYMNKTFDSEKLNAMLTPRVISDYFKEHGLNDINVVQKLENGTMIFPTDYFAPYHWWGGGTVTNNTIAIQQYQKGWGKENVGKIAILLAKTHYKFPRLYSKTRLFFKKLI